MEAHHWALRHDTERGGFKELKGYGRSGYGMKVFPVTQDFGTEEDGPSLTYRFYLEKGGDYNIEGWSAPVNSVQDKRPLRLAVEAGGVRQTAEVIPADFRAGDPGDKRWCQGVLDQVRVTKVLAALPAGLQTLTLCALEAGLVAERILVYPADKKLPQSYLGPQESFRV